MITPILERLLLTGRAVKRNKVHGMSAAGVIRCPEDRFIIVTEINYFPFVDQDARGADALFYQMNLKSKENNQNYVFKNWFSSDIADVPATTANGVIKIDCFDIFKSDCVIGITRVSDVSIATDVQFSALNPQAQQPFPPYGYGISTPVIRRYTMDEGTMLYPSGIDANYDLVPTARAREDFGTDTVVAKTQLDQPTSNNNFPCINFTVIEVISSALQNI